MATSYRVPAVLAGILLLIGSYVYFIDVPASQETEQETTAARRLIPFDDRVTTQLTLATPRETIQFARDDRGRWIIVHPLASPADAREVRKILRALTLGTIERVIQEDATDLEQYGLAPPRMTVTITDGHAPTTLHLGNPGPFSSSMYVRQGDAGPVVLTTLDVLTFAKKTLYTFRLKDVLFFNAAHVEQLQLEADNRTIQLYRVPGVHGITPNWRFRAPLDGPADKTEVGILVTALSDLEATAFVDDPDEKARILNAAPEPAARALVTTPRHKYRLSLYQQGEKTYATTEPEKPLYVVDAAIVNNVSQGVFDLQDKRLLGVAADKVAILAITTPQERYAVIHQNDRWLLEQNPEQPLDQKSVALLVSRIADLPAERRVSSTETNLPTYGLDQPQYTITATDTLGREHELLLGNAEPGLVYARGSGLPGIFQARSAILTQILSLASLTAP